MIGSYTDFLQGQLRRLLVVIFSGNFVFMFTAVNIIVSSMLLALLAINFYILHIIINKQYVTDCGGPKYLTGFIVCIGNLFRN